MVRAHRIDAYVYLGMDDEQLLPRRSASKIAILLIVLLVPQVRAQDAEFRQIDRIVEGGIAAKKFLERWSSPATRPHHLS